MYYLTPGGANHMDSNENDPPLEGQCPDYPMHMVALARDQDRDSLWRRRLEGYQHLDSI